MGEDTLIPGDFNRQCFFIRGPVIMAQTPAHLSADQSAVCLLSTMHYAAFFMQPCTEICTKLSSRVSNFSFACFWKRQRSLLSAADVNFKLNIPTNWCATNFSKGHAHAEEGTQTG